MIRFYTYKSMKAFLTFWSMVMFVFCSPFVWSQETSVHTKSFSSIPSTQINEQGYFVAKIDIANTPIKVKLISSNWQALEKLGTKNIPVSDELQYSIAYERKIPKLIVKIPAIRNHLGKLEQLQSAQIQIESTKSPTILAKPSYPANSVLASGKWYKIGVTQKGIYKIDAAFLNEIGINTSSVNAKNIRIYGNGGQVLTEIPDDSEPNDLVENAIWISSSGTNFSASDYILFYAPGPTRWTYQDGDGFVHTSNYYSDTAYYFINVDKGAGKRIAAAPVSASPVTSFTDFDDYTCIDLDSFHYSSAGRIWFSHRMFSDASFTLNQNLNFQLTDPVGPIQIDYQLGCTVPAGGSQIKMSQGSSTLGSVSFSSFISYDEVKIQKGTWTSTTSSASIPLALQFIPAGSGIGLLDFIRVKGKSFINMNGKAQLSFRNIDSRSYLDQPIAYQMQHVNSATKVWDVSQALEPKQLTLEVSGTNGTVKTLGNGINELIAFNSTSFLKPVFSKEIANQNLHALSAKPLIIITPEVFKPAADEIALLHQELDGYESIVVTTEQIYNEFSSGSQDVAGIRNFIRMFYDRASSPDEVPENVLFIGAASYDYKDRIKDNTNFVPNYQSYNSGNFGTAENSSYSSDDYYALLDSAEVLGGFSSSLYDIGLGRIPVRSVEESHQVVQKIRNYLSPKSFGVWKNSSLFLADDADGAGNFPEECDKIVDSLVSYSPILNNKKLYADVYEKEKGASGDTYPKVSTALNSEIFSGNFLINYSGHGNPQRLSHESILTKAQIASYRNFDKLPVIITGTCDFGRYDNPAFVSGGMELFIKSDGGSIASLTTTQQVFSFESTNLISKYIPFQFNKNADGSVPTMGEALMKAKNAAGGSTINNFKYVLLGDPALRLALPKLDVSTDSIAEFTSATTTQLTDTISALGNYILYGSVRDYLGMLQADFNGTVSVTIYDKPQENPISNIYPSYKKYKTQTSVVYKGQVSVKNGKFSINMVVPKDLNYEFGKGKISYYVYNEFIDGAGVDTNITIGGFADFSKEDNEPPVVKPYIDDEKFRDGGVTGPDPLLFVKLYDDNGINISGSSIGHDLIAILDGDMNNVFVLNNYYQTQPDDYKNGFVYFPMSGLSEGWHEIEVRAWDVYNNSGTGKVRFEVRKKDEAVISEVYNYPNPIYNSETQFVIQHNLKNTAVTIDILIYGNDGKLVQSLQKELNPGENRTEVSWNTGENTGKPIAPGLYLYKVILKNSENQEIVTSATHKFVFIK